jgi:hypothetical protein
MVLPAEAARDAAPPLPDAARFPEGGFLLERVEAACLKEQGGKTRRLELPSPRGTYMQWQHGL